MRMRTDLACLAGALALTLAACGGGDKPAPAAQAPGTTAGTSTGAAAFGVPECDDYLAKYEACVDSKVPESARATVRLQIDQTKAAWTQVAATPQGKASLAVGCRQATETAKTAMAAYGCKW